MKKISLILVGLQLAMFSFSQDYKRKTPEEKAKKFTAEMAAEITLEKNQEESIYLINLEVSKRFDSLYASRPDKETMRKHSREIFIARDQEFRKVLTTEQFLRYDDIQREKYEKKLKEKLAKDRAMEMDSTKK